ncbi:ammonia channel protein [Candidatus Kaiserbacteria bacterium RIFCSPHIGHO2_02_FULL_55_25]|uniref:Ammonium transporter n=1 Tax=Candidatus Kaiserbacteria bacterium RIFCSPHIGHO2_02_FULL_55_25 TaxID=1798498 RepID=A0A1F6E4P5_9BACT|nr:MAG: ammonia channel protein [Candidatus Kaiserbacteria bacterium RIFCSPHIGHO2_02_FULL_55_25]
MWWATILLILGCAVGYASMSFGGASAGEYDASLINAGDTAWVLLATALVMLMTPAVGFFYGGMVSSKNVVSVIKQSMVILALVSVQWVVLGYTLAFGPDVGGVIGNLDFFGLKGVGFAPNADYAATIPHLSFMAFQAMFAIITPALIIGAFVGRIRFKTLVIFTLLWTTLVYDPIAHSVWAVGGWIRDMGALDFAGGTVVHMSAGFSALAAAILVGRRLDQSEPSVSANNVPFVILGAALLWFGWFGFNAGSALAAGALAASAFVVTNTAAAAAALTWVALSWAQNGKPSAMAAAIGAVCGLVAITPASGYVGPVASIAIGIIAGVVTYTAVYIRSRKTRVDDTLDVWAAHGVGGLAGAVLTGFFAEKAINAAGNNGALFGNPDQVIVQILAVAATATYAFVATYVLLKVISFFSPLRVESHEEEEGLDMATHGESAYRH